jgi:hypothetical protein
MALPVITLRITHRPKQNPGDLLSADVRCVNRLSALPESALMTILPVAGVWVF